MADAAMIQQQEDEEAADVAADAPGMVTLP